MRDIFAEINRKNRAIKLVVILLVVYNLLILIQIILVPYPVAQIANADVGISVSEYKLAFQKFINEESEKLQMPPAALKVRILSSGCIAASYIVFALFLGMRKKFAKYSILTLVVVQITIDIVVGIKYSILPSKISIIIAIFLLLFLFSPSISKELR